MSRSDLIVVAALRVEAWALRSGSPQLSVLRCGMGPRRSLRSAPRLLEEPARCVAVAGLCGAVDPELSPGDVVLASELLAEDAPPRSLETDALAAALGCEGIRVRVGPVFSARRLVTGEARERLRGSGALVVDMESAWLAGGAGRRPLGVLRVVVDTPERELLRAGALQDAWRALGRLRAAAPALARWGAETVH